MKPYLLYSLNRFREFRLLACLFILFVISSSVAAQDPSSISGIVNSDAGDPLPGVSIDMKNDATNERKTTLSNANGQFTISNLNPQSTYTITFSFIGFDSYILKSYQYKSSDDNLSITLSE